MNKNQKTKEKTCAFYASDYHFEMISLPYINKKLDESKEVIVLTENNLKETIKTLVSKINLNEDKKVDILKIDWENKTAQEIKNLVRGLNPIMGTYSFLDGKKFKFWKVEILLSQPEYESQDNGTIIKSDSKDGLYIKAKDGIIKVLEIQAENAKKMNIGDFLRGNALEVGKKFE